MSAGLDFLTIATPLPDTTYSQLQQSAAAKRSTNPTSTPSNCIPERLCSTRMSCWTIRSLVTLGDPTGAGRYFSGIVRAVQQLPYASKLLWRYQLSLVPKLWFLGQTQDCRFYQKMTVPDIVEQILGNFNITYSSKLQGSYTARDYTVQFNESYLHFIIQRILEDEGIFYFFSHAENAHTMVLADQNTAFQPINQASISLDEQTAGFGALNTWHLQDSTAIGKIRLDDYNPETGIPVPGAVTGAETTVLKASAASQRSQYAWPAVRGTTSDAASRAKWHMQAAEGASHLFGGEGKMLDFTVGGKFTIQNDPLRNRHRICHSLRRLSGGRFRDRRRTWRCQHPVHSAAPPSLPPQPGMNCPALPRR